MSGDDMITKLKTIVRIIIMLSCVSCAGTIEKTASADSSRSVLKVYLVNYGWHTGLIIGKSSIPEGLWPESADFPGAQYLEVGWGDRDYYQASRPDLWMTLKAALVPTASVLYVKPVVMPSRLYYERIEFKLNSEAFYHLCRYIHESYDRNGLMRAVALAPVTYSGGRFYPARGSFHLLRTCNAWTASALKAAGIPMGVFSGLSASRLMEHARQFAIAGGCPGSDCTGVPVERPGL
jgi:uncharacterized protein (TIGR02117 family)